MKRYHTTSLYIFSTVGGIVTFLISSFFTDDLPMQVFFAAITTLLISITVPAMFAIADRKFMPVIKQIKDKIVIDERVHYIVGKELRQGFMLTTKDNLYVISSENNKPVKLELKRSDIKKISVTDGVYLNIFLDFDKCIRVFASDCEDLLNRLHSEGFGK